MTPSDPSRQSAANSEQGENPQSFGHQDLPAELNASSNAILPDSEDVRPNSNKQKDPSLASDPQKASLTPASHARAALSKVVQIVIGLALVPFLIIGIVMLVQGFNPSTSPLKTEMWVSILGGSFFILLPFSFFGFQVNKVQERRRGTKRAKRYWLLPLTLSLIALLGAVSVEGNYGSYLANTGNFREVLAKHDVAREECYEMVMDHSNFPLNSEMAEGTHAISISSEGDGVIHRFEGVAHFSNGFGVKSEYSYQCEMSQERRFVSSDTSKADLEVLDIDVHEAVWNFDPDDELESSDGYVKVNVADVRGIGQFEYPPSNIYVVPGYFEDLSN